ncbi:MAG: hypothetical protein AAFQ04_08775 [Pseudomonadota bacterium]
MPHTFSIRFGSIAIVALGTLFAAHAQDTTPDEDVGALTSASGKTCYVSKVRFDNKGAYTLSHFEVEDYEFAGYLVAGESRTWDLGKSNLKSGDTFYLSCDLDQGLKSKSMNCKKSGTTLKYHPNGNTWSHWSKGSTTNNNRCRYRNNNCIRSVD